MVKKLTKRIRTKEKEAEMTVRGRFMSIQDMKDEGMKEARIQGIKADCEAGPKNMIRPGSQTFACMCIYIYSIYIYTCRYTCIYIYVYMRVHTCN